MDAVMRVAFLSSRIALLGICHVRRLAARPALQRLRRAVLRVPLPRQVSHELEKLLEALVVEVVALEVLVRGGNLQDSFPELHLARRPLLSE